MRTWYIYASINRVLKQTHYFHNRLILPLLRWFLFGSVIYIYKWNEVRRVLDLSMQIVSFGSLFALGMNINDEMMKLLRMVLWYDRNDCDLKMLQKIHWFTSSLARVPSTQLEKNLVSNNFSLKTNLSQRLPRWLPAHW